jgi:hypothetical protein
MHLSHTESVVPIMNKIAAQSSNQGQLIRANAVAVMCDKCVELDKKLEQYRRIASSITDQLTIDRINKVIKDTIAEKARLHPDQKQ